MKGSGIRLGVLIIAVTFTFAASAARVIDEQSLAPSKTTTGMLHRASNLIGLPVLDANGHNIGTIEDLVLDNSLNRVTDAVFSHRAARGEGIEHFAIPFSALSMNTDGNAVIVNTNVSRLEGTQLLPEYGRVSERAYQGPIDVEAGRDTGLWRDNRYRYSPAAEELEAEGKPFGPPVRDIYGRPLVGKARTPYVQNVYRDSSKGQSRFPADQYTYKNPNLRGYERDQYGRPVYERDYYTRDTYGHNGYSVSEDTWRAPSDNVYGRPVEREKVKKYSRTIDRDPWRGTINENTWDVYGNPGYPEVYGRPMQQNVQRDWHWGDGLRNQPVMRHYTGDTYFDTYGRPMSRDFAEYYNQYGRPIEKDTYTDRYGAVPWFHTDWARESGQLGLRRASNLLGTDFQVSGRDAGSINDLVIDMREGQVAYVVVALADDFANANNKVAAIPWQAVDLNLGQRFANVEINRDQLLRMSYNAGSLPNLNDMNVARRLHQQFEVSPYWETLGYVAPTSEQFSGDAWKSGSPFMKAFDAKRITTITGTIESISTFKPAANASAGMRLRIRTDDGKLMLVNAGPMGFMNQQTITFNNGDRITVTGSRAHLAGQNVILASELMKGNQTVQLRTNEGRPLW